MSDRVNRVKFKINKETYAHIANQVKILIECGYNCFITKGFSQDNAIILEFAEADPECTNRSIYQPCWLTLDELEYLSEYQLSNLLSKLEEEIKVVEEELDKGDTVVIEDDDSRHDA